MLRSTFMRAKNCDFTDLELFNSFKNKLLVNEEFDDHYDAVHTLREIIEAIRNKDDEDGASGEYGELDPALEILHELAPQFSEETIEDIIDGLFDYYLDDDDDDDLDDFMENIDEEDFCEDDFGLLDERINPVQAKRLRYLKAKRRKQLGKRGNSMTFKRTHHFDNKKRRFVKRKKAVSVSAMRKKARIFKKVKRKGSTKAKAKRMKKRLKNVRNPYGK